MKPSIVIADDHPLVLKGLQDFLTEKGFDILASANDGKTAYNLIIEHSPDIAILDIRMPNLSGIEIAQLCKDLVHTKIILITFEKNRMLYDQAKELNIFGYLLKEFALTEIENCLESVYQGTPYFSPEIESHFAGQSSKVDINTLTPAERRVLKLIAKNNSAKEIADILSISNRTVEKHKENIIKKLDLGSHKNNLLFWATENSDIIF